MKCKIIVIGVAMMIAMSFPAIGKIVEYKDDYVSFSYDDEMIGTIEQSVNAESNTISYDLASRCLKEEGSAGCHFGISPKENEFDGHDLGINRYKGKENDENPSKILSEGSEKFAHISFYSDSENDNYNKWAREFYDSFGIHFDIDDLEIRSDNNITIYSNEILSEQGYTYCEKALEILNSYMDMTMDPNDASSEIESLSDRVDSYSEVSDYYADSSIKYAISLSHLNIMMEKDGMVQETIDELNSLMKNKPE